MPLPTAYADFFEQTFGKDIAGAWSPAYALEVAEDLDAIDECSECGKPVINLTAFVEAIGEHYVLTDEQLERLEVTLTESGLDVSDDELCLDHAAD